MSNPTEQHLAGLAKDLELAAALIRSHGLRALVTTEAWMLGPRSANLDPDAGGWRWENIAPEGQPPDVVPVPTDSTGEAILRPDLVGDRHGRLAAAIRFLGPAADEVISIVRMACPDPTALSLNVDDMTATQVSAAGWCISCWRDEGYLNPVAMRPDGKRRYRDYCQWCGEWHAAQNGRQPPLRLVQLRRAGKRITERLVVQALAEENAERQEAKKDRKKNRRKKRAA